MSPMPYTLRREKTEMGRTNFQGLRTITPLMLRYYNLAIEQGLTFCVGRAAYMVNRHYNGDLRRMGLAPEREVGPRWLRKAQITALRGIRLSTARRWSEHWGKGGSLKALSYTEPEWNQIRKERRADLMERISGKGWV